MLGTVSVWTQAHTPRVQTCVHCDLGVGSRSGLLPLGVVPVWTQVCTPRTREES